MATPVQANYRTGSLICAVFAFVIAVIGVFICLVDKTITGLQIDAMIFAVLAFLALATFAGAWRV